MDAAVRPLFADSPASGDSATASVRGPGGEGVCGGGGVGDGGGAGAGEGGGGANGTVSRSGVSAADGTPTPGSGAVGRPAMGGSGDEAGVGATEAGGTGTTAAAAAAAAVVAKGKQSAACDVASTGAAVAAVALGDEEDGEVEVRFAFSIHVFFVFKEFYWGRGKWGARDHSTRHYSRDYYFGPGLSYCVRQGVCVLRCFRSVPGILRFQPTIPWPDGLGIASCSVAASAA